MTINERVRYFRKEILKMNQRAFAKCLGMKQTSISNLENVSVSEPAIRSMCLAFNLNEDWLRYGTEPMYLERNVFFSEIHERIKYFRKECLHLSQTEFGEKLGVSRSVINNIERNVLSRPDQKTSLLKLVCHEFEINEKWLLSGIGPMYNNNDDVTSLNELTKIIDKYGISDQELEFARSYLKLDPDFRHALLECFRKLFYSDKVES
jgi:transcriptional regulator with XRE-family HTH domain